MHEKVKSLITCLALVLASSAADSGEATTCEELALLPSSYVATSLRAMSQPVFGKYPDLWTRDDFDRLLSFAEACDGQPEGMKITVDAQEWRRAITQVEPDILEVSRITRAIHSAYSADWAYGPLPSCVTVLDWERDGTWPIDNSAAIFGVDLKDMDSNGRRLAQGLARECLPVMQTVLANHRLRPETAKDIVEDIKRTAEKVEQAALEDPDRLSPALRVSHQGRFLPLSYLSPESRRMVLAADRIETGVAKLTPGQSIMFADWAKKIETSGRGGPEELYAEAVMAVVSKHMFTREEP